VQHNTIDEFVDKSDGCGEAEDKGEGGENGGRRQKGNSYSPDVIETTIMRI
jgi:hypothetical protein